MSRNVLYSNNGVSKRAYTITEMQRKCDPTFVVILPYLQECLYFSLVIRIYSSWLVLAIILRR